MRHKSGKIYPDEAPEPVPYRSAPPSNLPDPSSRQGQGGVAPRPSYRRGKNIRRASNGNYDSRSSTSSRTSNPSLSRIPTLPTTLGPSPEDIAHQNIGGCADADDSDISTSKSTQSTQVGTSDRRTFYSPTELSERDFSVSTSGLKANDDSILDVATNTVAKLPDELISKTKELIIQSPDAGSEGWFSSPDNGLQYVFVVQRGLPYIWFRNSGLKLAVDELFSSSLISGNPPVSNGMKGKSERLDSAFATRSSDFFTLGKVFATLFTEPWSEANRSRESPNVSKVLFGEKVFTQISRFVVVQMGKGFCYACPILMYGGRGTLKPGCNPSEHAIAYMQGDNPTLFDGERNLTKLPIEIVPSATDTQHLDRASRIRFGRGQVIQHNVKAKEIGHVAEHHLSRLLAYWREEICRECGCGCVNGSNAEDTPSFQGSSSVEKIEEVVLRTYSPFPSNLDHKQPNGPSPRRDVIQLNGIEYVIISEVGGQLHSGFETVRKPRSFFKKGRSFMVFWPELAGNPESERTIYWKIRRFVVIRTRSTHCLCLPMSTYQGQGTTKAGVSIQDHAAVVPVDSHIKLQPEEEEQLTKSPLYIKTEDPSITIDPASRINFAKVYTVEYNLKVRNLGRIISDSIQLMEEYFAETIKLAV